MSVLSSKPLHTATTAISIGGTISVTYADTLVVSVSGTSTSFTIQFEGSLDGVNYFVKMGDKVSDYLVSSTTTSTLNEAWEFDVSALHSFRANLTAIGNGNITVVANSSK